ncbi:MAG: YraN family protein [Pseudomonadales bacterium]|nr:YraN family protein [Pseudomonadales bacterium]
MQKFPRTDTRQTGRHHETLALAYLEKAGLRLIQRNFNCRLGEIDLIMHDRDQLVFVEVRYRRQEQRGSGIESVTPGKQRKIIRAAKLYLLSKGLYERISCRFDVVGLRGDMQNPEFHWLKNAFV